MWDAARVALGLTLIGITAHFYYVALTHPERVQWYDNSFMSLRDRIRYGGSQIIAALFTGYSAFLSAENVLGAIPPRIRLILTINFAVMGTILLFSGSRQMTLPIGPARQLEAEGKRALG